MSVSAQAINMQSQQESSWREVLSGLESYLNALELAISGQGEWPSPYNGGPGRGEMTPEERIKAEAMLARIRLLESTVVEMRDGVGVSLATLNNLTSAKNVSAGDRPDPIYVDKRA